MEANNLKEKIIHLYYDEHLKSVEIAKIVNKTPQYISKVIKEDDRYKIEKEYKHNESIKRKRQYNKEYNKTYIRKDKENKEEYYALLELLKRDSKILSTRTEMSDIDFAKWNRSIYQYDKKSSNLVLKNGINVTKDVPRIVRNVVKASSIRSSNVYAR